MSALQEESEEEDEEIRLMKALNAKKNEKQAKSAAAEGALGIPRFVEKCGFLRCNCRDGIKNLDFDYVPLPKPFMAGFIRVMTYEIQKEKQHTLYKELKAKELIELRQKLHKKMTPFIPHILSYLPLSECAPTAISCKSWSTGSNECALYKDMRDSTPWIVFKPHHNQTDSILRIGDKVYSGGDRRVYVSDAFTGEKLHMMTRDTGLIPTLLKVDDTIFCCSNQGAVRVFNIMHNVKRIYLDLTMWEHSRRITELLFEKPSVGNCEIHGIEDHVCRMYTVSEDRMIVVWDTNKHCPVKSIKPRLLKDNIINSITMTDRHFFCGTSGGTIQVFSKLNVCEREDIHNCLVAVKDQSDSTEEIGRVVDPNIGEVIDRKWCLQITLRIPNTKDFADCTPMVNVVLCCGPNKSDDLLHCGDSTGRHTIWRIPDKGLDFVPIKTHTPHTRSINIMKNTNTHLITASDDGTMVFMDLVQLTQIRRIDVLQWALDKNLIADDSADIPREIKCLHLMENEIDGGTISVGTNYGEVMLIDIGTTV
jgi:WD40 repeat protein